MAASAPTQRADDRTRVQTTPVATIRRALKDLSKNNAIFRLFDLRKSNAP
jgi:hypothetical protein